MGDRLMFCFTVCTHDRYQIMRIFVFFALILYPVCLSAQKHRHPNFVVILADDHAYRAIGYNNPGVITPNIDKLAASGVIFERAYAATPICAASRASLLTGLYPQTNGSVALDHEAFIQSVVNERSIKTVAHYLQAGGYNTFYVGKSHFGQPMEFGFLKGKSQFDPTGDRNFNDVLGFLDDSLISERPFFLQLDLGQPHVPLKPEQKWLDLYAEDEIKLDPNFRQSPDSLSIYNQGLPGQLYFANYDYRDNYKNLPSGPPRVADTMRMFIKAYYAMISQMDHQIGKFIDDLKSRGLWDNTVLIFLSDNGYFLGNHGLGNKINMMEESVRIPMFMHWDGIARSGRRVPEIVSSVDILPTVLELAGLDAPTGLQGRSLVPFLTTSLSEPLHHFVASECTGVGGSLGIGHRMVVTKSWKYILSDINDEALFHLDSDPYEMDNLINQSEYAAIVKMLRRHYWEWRETVGDKKPFNLNRSTR